MTNTPRTDAVIAKSKARITKTTAQSDALYYKVKLLTELARQLEREALQPAEVVMGEDAEYLAGRLQIVIELIRAKEYHMAVAKLLADISALRTAAQQTAHGEE